MYSARRRARTACLAISASPGQDFSPPSTTCSDCSSNRTSVLLNMLLEGDISATLSGNFIRQSRQTELVVTFVRRATTLKLAQPTPEACADST